MLVQLLLAVIGAAVLFWKHREVAASIENFRNNWPGGGPGTPTHPVPARDFKPGKRTRTV